ncbi:MAG: hypothetical protein DWI22_02940 [Planctomycetota bacterium]|nr:MAG: hypothetical protein DWI22_02940 [Planctomycetota bacterium]
MKTLTILLLYLGIPAGEPSSFYTGKELKTSLATNVRWVSIGSELGDQLRDLQTQTNVAILRDRRLDPHRRINVETEFVPRVQVLKQISATIPGAALCITEDCACIGPSDAIYRLPILLSSNAEQLHGLRTKIDTTALRRLTVKVDASWEQLAEPRQILLDHAQTAGVVITNPDAIPHDVWAQQRLPQMSFAHLTTLILNQFDLTFEIATDRAELTIVQIDSEDAIEHRYPVGSTFKATVVNAWQQQAPNLEIRWTGSNATVTTTLRQHILLNAALHAAWNSGSNSDATLMTQEGSIRTRNFQLKAERATIGQLIVFFRTEKIRIEVRDEDSAEVTAILLEPVQLDTRAGKQAGEKLFPLIFGKHFKTVDVRDDRVVLSQE